MLMQSELSFYLNRISQTEVLDAETGENRSPEGLSGKTTQRLATPSSAPNLRLVVEYCASLYQSRAFAFGPGRGGQHRPDQSGRGLQSRHGHPLFNLCRLVDQAGDPAAPCITSAQFRPRSRLHDRPDSAAARRRSELHHELNRDPTPDELAFRMQVSIKQIRMIHRAPQCVSAARISADSAHGDHATIAMASLRITGPSVPTTKPWETTR